MQRGVKALIIVIVISALLLGIQALVKNKTPKSTEPDMYEVVTMAEYFVKQNLKAPSTAEFCPVREAKIGRLGNNEYEVTGYVDAQNSFGAMIRSTYYVKMRTISFSTKSLSS